MKASTIPSTARYQFFWCNVTNRADELGHETHMILRRTQDRLTTSYAEPGGSDCDCAQLTTFFGVPAANAAIFSAVVSRMRSSAS